MSEMKTQQAPNREYLEFSYVQDSATGKGLNQRFVMEAQSDTGKFRCTEGRIGIRVGANKPKTWLCSMEEWDDVYSQKISRGWILISTKKMEQKKIVHEGTSLNGETYQAIAEKETRELIEMLLSFGQQAVEESYTTRIDMISPEMMALGKQILDYLANGSNLSVAAFNTSLKKLYSVIPRRIDNLSSKLAKRQADFGQIVESEQDLYQILSDQMKLTETSIAASKTQTITEAFGLEWRLATADEKAYVLSLMNERNRGQVANVWRVRNLKTEARFDKWCAEHNISEGHGISHLFHGSPAPNWWSITTNGLWIRPGLNGGMFGPGLYFAPESDKSMGYTGFGCWRGCGDSVGFMSVNKVATGNPFWFYRNNGTNADMSLAAMKKHGTDCLWAEGSYTLKNSQLRRDEVIIYDDAQSTIEYFIEVKAR